MTPYTPEEIARAREIAAETVIRLNDGDQRSHNHAADILEGKCDNESLAIHSALAAIRATTERAAKLSQGHFWKQDFASALRANEHLKDRTDAG